MDEMKLYEGMERKNENICDLARGQQWGKKKRDIEMRQERNMRT
jgi:hypothetical protein